MSLDLAVAAALDAVKENVLLPWAVKKDTSTPPVSGSEDAPKDKDPIPKTVEVTATEGESPKTEIVATLEPAQTPHQQRVIHQRNFEKALKEITPSSSESLGSLAELRKWNEQFGEGRKNRKKVQVWGKERFGFRDPSKDVLAEQEGRVLPTSDST